MDINRINPNYNINLAPKANKKTDDKKVAEDKKQPETNFQSADDVLNHLSQAAGRIQVDAAAPKTASAARTIEVSKYVTPEQAARIAGFAAEFENAHAAYAKGCEQEFGHLAAYKDMSDGAKSAVATAAFLKDNMPDMISA